MEIIQVTNGWGSKSDQEGIAVGRKYFYTYYLNNNGEWIKNGKHKINKNKELVKAYRDNDKSVLKEECNKEKYWIND